MLKTPYHNEDLKIHHASNQNLKSIPENIFGLSNMDYINKTNNFTIKKNDDKRFTNSNSIFSLKSEFVRSSIYKFLEVMLSRHENNSYYYSCSR